MRRDVAASIRDVRADLCEQQLIRETARSIIDIGLEVGYTSPNYFTKVFRRVTGARPSHTPGVSLKVGCFFSARSG